MLYHFLISLADSGYLSHVMLQAQKWLNPIQTANLPYMPFCLVSQKFQQIGDKINAVEDKEKVTNRKASFFCCKLCSSSCVSPAVLVDGNVVDSSGSADDGDDDDDDTGGSVAVWTWHVTASACLAPGWSTEHAVWSRARGGGGFELGKCPARRWAWIWGSNGLCCCWFAVAGLTNTRSTFTR